MLSKCLLCLFVSFHNIALHYRICFVYYFYYCRQKSNEEEEVASRLTNLDRICWIECLIDDSVIEAYRASQVPLSRQELDARNSPERPPTVHEAIAEKFNDEDWKPWSQVYQTLHIDFAQQIWLLKGDMEMTSEKSKYIMADMRPCLTQMIHNYEESGQGAGNREIEDKDWGYFDISKGRGIDDRSKFLLWKTKTSLLYMWARLDEYNLLSFTCSKLPFSHVANSDHAPQVSTTNINKDKNDKMMMQRNHLWWRARLVLWVLL